MNRDVTWLDDESPATSTGPSGSPRPQRRATTTSVGSA